MDLQPDNTYLEKVAETAMLEKGLPGKRPQAKRPQAKRPRTKRPQAKSPLYKKKASNIIQPLPCPLPRPLLMTERPLILH